MHDDVLFLQLPLVHLSNVVVKENYVGHADARTVHVMPIAQAHARDERASRRVIRVTVDFAGSEHEERRFDY